MAEVRLQEGEPLENALRPFKRKVQAEDIIKEVKRHSYYLKPGAKRRVKQALARKQKRKAARTATLGRIATNAVKHLAKAKHPPTSIWAPAADTPSCHVRGPQEPCQLSAPQDENGAGEFPITLDLPGANSGVDVTPLSLTPGFSQVTEKVTAR